MLNMMRNWAACLPTVLAMVPCLALLTSSTSYPETGATESIRPMIEFDRTFHVFDAAGDPVQVRPGTYAVSANQGHLQLTGEMTDKPILLEAQPTTHEENIPSAFPLSFSEQADEQVLILLLPDGTALELLGSYSGILSRAASRNRTRVSSATIHRQFNRAQLANRVPKAIPYDFTLRVPVHLTNLSPDINQIKIRCWTHIGQDATKPDFRIGEGESVAPVSNRRYQGTMTVHFNAKPRKEAQDADRYYCGMLFHKPGIGFRQPGKFGTPLGNQKPDWLVSAENSPFRIHAQGGVQ